MRKTRILVLLILSIYFQNAIAQENKKLKIDFIVFGGNGYGILQNDNETNYNLNSNSREVLLNFNINEKFGIVTVK